MAQQLMEKRLRAENAAAAAPSGDAASAGEEARVKDASGEERGQDSQVPGLGMRTGESQSRSEDLQLVGQELVPASQALL